VWFFHQTVSSSISHVFGELKMMQSSYTLILFSKPCLAHFAKEKSLADLNSSLGKAVINLIKKLHPQFSEFFSMLLFFK
jgi:hypothetical protein